jgi:hypothetical protein
VSCSWFISTALNHVKTDHILKHSVTGEDVPTWVWNPEASDHPENDDLSAAFFYDKNEIVRFRVEEEVWHDASPEKPDFSSNVNGDLTIRAHVTAGGFNKKDDEKTEALKRPVPYAIIGSMAAAGLGCVHWWRLQGEDDDEDADDGVDEMDVAD